MAIDTIERDFKAKVCERLKVVSEGLDRYRVFTPFLFEDGDHLSIVLRKEGGEWLLSDEGHTYMHLTYDMEERDLQQGTRQKIITNALTAFAVDDHDGELVLSIPDERYGDALYTFVQALSRSRTCHSSLANRCVRPSWTISADSWKSRSMKRTEPSTGPIRGHL